MKKQIRTVAVSNNVADDFSAAMSKAVHSIYSEHPHECNMLLYIGAAVLFSFGAYSEFRAIPRSV